MKFDLESIFHVVVSGQELERPKPNPDIFFETAGRLNIEPAGCVVIEDSTAGINAAKSAGMTCVGFRSPNSKNQEYDSADIVVDHINEINLTSLKTGNQK